MKNSKILKLLLLASGLIAIGIGGAILFTPASFYAIYGIELANDASLASEIRAPGGALLVTGMLMLVGVFVEKFALASTVIVTAVYSSYGLSRLLSMAVDGMPDSGLVEAAAFELAIATAGLFALHRYRLSA